MSDNNRVDKPELNTYINNIIDNIKEKEHLVEHIKTEGIHMTSSKKEQLQAATDSIFPDGEKYETYFITEDNSRNKESDSIFKFGEFVISSTELETAKLETTYNRIYDLLNKKVYVKSGSSFIENSSLNIYNEVGIGRFLYNLRTKSLFFIKNNLDLFIILIANPKLIAKLKDSLKRSENLADLLDFSKALENLELVGDVTTHYHDNMYITKIIMKNDNYGTEIIDANNLYIITDKNMVTDAKITEWTNKINQTDIDNTITEFYARLKDDVVNGINDHSIKDYIDICDFLNFSPKAGYLDEKTIPIYASYNMSYSVYSSPFKIISDGKGREMLYLEGSNGRTETLVRLYRAYRMMDLEDFIFDNTPIIPAHLIETEYPTFIHGLNTNYIVYRTNLGNIYLVKHGGDSDYAKWTSDKVVNLTNLISSNSISLINTIQYWEEYNTVVIYHLPPNANYGEVSSEYSKFLIKIFDITTSNLIYETSYMFNIDSSYYETFYNTSYRAPSGMIQPSVIYNEKQKQLVIVGTYLAFFKPPGGATTHGTRRTIQIFPMEKTFFKDGSGGLTPTIPSDKYNWYYSGNGTGISDSLVATCIIYDNNDDCIRSGTISLNSYTTHSYKVRANNRDYQDTRYIDGNYELYETLIAPDTCPWAKQMNRPFFFHDGTIQFVGSSKKYGKSNVYTEYDTTSLDDNGYIQFSAGKWWREPYSTVIDPVHITVIETKENEEVMYTRVANNNAYLLTVEDFIDDNGIHRKGKNVNTLLIESLEIPDSTKYVTRWKVYDSVRNIVYFYVCDKVSDDPVRQGWVYIIKYDYNTQTWTEYKNISSYMESWYTDVYNRRNAAVDVHYNTTNTFIDINGNLYFSLRATTPGGTVVTYLITLNVETGEYMFNNLSLASYWGNAFIGWDKHLGYYACMGHGYGLPQTGMIWSTRSLNSGNPEKTFQQLLNRTGYYQSRIGLSSAIGLVAYVQSYPIFLGGYFSQIETQEVALYADSLNYIYLVRDRSDRYKINIIVRKKIIGVVGENSFNRVLATKIVTDVANPISQEDFEI